MNANERESLNKLLENVVGAAYEVANVLGCGFLEKVYERALVRELASRGVSVRSQAKFSVTYKGEQVGEYAADLIVEDRLVVELKCAECLSNEHIAQCLNYLRASGLSLAPLINFQRSKVEWKRIAYGL
jgi:GxxExxY protein